MRNAEIADANIADLVGIKELLHLPPSVHVVPVLQRLALIIRIETGGPVHQVQIHIVHSKVLQTFVYGLENSVMPIIIQLRGQPDLLTRNTGGPDSLPDLLLVSIGKGCVYMPVATPECPFHSHLNRARLGLPGSQPYGGHNCTRVERDSFPYRGKTVSDG